MTPDYSREPPDARQFSAQYDAFYSHFANNYDRLIRLFPLWRNWLDNTLPYIQGPKVLEVSFGTGYLLSRYASHFKSFAININPAGPDRLG